MLKRLISVRALSLLIITIMFLFVPSNLVFTTNGAESNFTTPEGIVVVDSIGFMESFFSCIR
jgi:hypothetical protein